MKLEYDWEDLGSLRDRSRYQGGANYPELAMVECCILLNEQHADIINIIHSLSLHPSLSLHLLLLIPPPSVPKPRLLIHSNPPFPRSPRRNVSTRPNAILPHLLFLFLILLPSSSNPMGSLQSQSQYSFFRCRSKKKYPQSSCWGLYD